MENEHASECSGCENYCINCGKVIPFIGNPFTPGMWVCEECQAEVNDAATDLPE